ncbi:MAG: phosphoesterase [Lachnospiraceae bacterium]|nr:phosphoesterase [Lachnospiraceae bacterium]
MMSVFFIADTHFGDDDIRRYENRPFKDTDEMDRVIADNWNRVVSEEDEVFLLGDIGDVKSLENLKGKKFLIKGNHDTMTNEEYRTLGFCEVYDRPVIFESFWILSHEPLYVNRNMPYANIFGHIHNDPAYRSVSSRSRCVSVERILYTPISFEQIVSEVKKEDERESNE